MTAIGSKPVSSRVLDAAIAWQLSLDSGDGSAVEREEFSKWLASDEEHARPPSIGDVAEPKLRHRVRDQEAHLERAGCCQRQIEVRDQQRQKRGVDIRVAVHDEVRAREQHDRGVQSEEPAIRHAPARRLRASTAIASWNSRTRNT